MSNSPESGQARTRSGVTVELPERLPVLDAVYQRQAAKARANPQAFFTALYEAIPKVFFLLLPLFALYLELFYRKDGFYIDHLVFSLYYHAFVFAMLSILFLVNHTSGWTPWWLRATLGVAGTAWIVVHLPLALQRVYGGAKWLTGLKVVGLWMLYLLTAVSLGQMLAYYLAMSSL